MPAPTRKSTRTDFILVCPLLKSSPPMREFFSIATSITPAPHFPTHLVRWTSDHYLCTNRLQKCTVGMKENRYSPLSPTIRRKKPSHKEGTHLSLNSTALTFLNTHYDSSIKYRTRCYQELQIVNAVTLTRNERVLGAPVDEGDLLVNACKSKQGGWRNLPFSLLQGRKQVHVGVVETNDHIAVSLGVGSP